jgi:hypothetical protein
MSALKVPEVRGQSVAADIAHTPERGVASEGVVPQARLFFGRQLLSLVQQVQRGSGEARRARYAAMTEGGLLGWDGNRGQQPCVGPISLCS